MKSTGISREIGGWVKPQPRVGARWYGGYEVGGAPEGRGAPPTAMQTPCLAVVRRYALEAFRSDLRVSSSGRGGRPPSSQGEGGGDHPSSSIRCRTQVQGGKETGRGGGFRSGKAGPPLSVHDLPHSSCCHLVVSVLGGQWRGCFFYPTLCIENSCPEIRNTGAPRFEIFLCQRRPAFCWHHRVAGEGAARPRGPIPGHGGLGLQLLGAGVHGSEGACGGGRVRDRLGRLQVSGGYEKS